MFFSGDFAAVFSAKCNVTGGHPRLGVGCRCWCIGRLLLSILPLQVEEMKRRQYTLAFTSAGAQAQTYHVSFGTLTECQRWHRQASTVRPWEQCGLDGGCRVHHRKGILMQACSAVRDEVRMLGKVPRTLSSFISFMLWTAEIFLLAFSFSLPAQQCRAVVLCCFNPCCTYDTNLITGP